MTATDPALGLIVATNSACRIKEQEWPGIPTLIWPDGIDETASDWLRALVLHFGVTSSTAHEYANIIRPFLRFCRQRKRPWSSVDDDFLILWREHLRRGRGISVGRTNTSLRTIFAFYQWAEESKALRYHVGIYADSDLPSEQLGVPFPISATRSFSKGKHGNVFGSWTTPLTLVERSEAVRTRHTPSEEEIRKLHSLAIESRNGERDSLILSWAEEAGPRRAELLRVGVSQLPTPDRLAELLEKDLPWLVSVPRKGGTSRPFNVPLDLVIRTLDYVQFDRQAIVERFLQSSADYEEPDHIFLSTRTGKALHPDSVTTIGTRLFRLAGVRKANIHRLRARFAVRVIETLVDATFDGHKIGSDSSWIETILVKAAEMMGHSSPASLKPYLTYVLNRRLQTSDASKAAALETRLRQLAIQEQVLLRRLDEHKLLQEAAALIGAGKKVDAAEILRRAADRLEQ